MRLQNLLVLVLQILKQLEAKNYYDILEINQDATEADIKRAFRKQSQQYHPDKRPAGMFVLDVN